MTIARSIPALLGLLTVFVLSACGPDPAELTRTALAAEAESTATQAAVVVQQTQIAVTLTREARSGVLRNADWTPVERTFDGVTMVLVPAGCFTMGSTDEEQAFAQSLGLRDRNVPDEGPAHEICFESAFWLDKYEVTQAQAAALNGVFAQPSSFAGDNRPVDMASWFEARDFCALRGMRLPTEAEWEYAARGPDGLIFPWGNEWVAENAVWNREQINSRLGTVDVGSIPEGASWVGALDMSGNVWEWTSSAFGPYPYDASREASPDDAEIGRARRGGSWFGAYPVGLRAAYRLDSTPDFVDFFNGFRCARDDD